MINNAIGNKIESALPPSINNVPADNLDNAYIRVSWEPFQPPDYRELKGCLNLPTQAVDNVVGTLNIQPQITRKPAFPDNLVKLTRSNFSYLS